MKTATKVLLTAFLTLALISNAATLEITDAGNPKDITIGNETLQTVYDIEVESPNSTEAHLYYSIGSLREAEVDLDSVSGPSAENVYVDGANFSNSNFNSNSGNYVLELVFTDTEDTFRIENFTYGSLGTDGASVATGLKFYAAADNETNSSLSGSNDAPDSSDAATSSYAVTSNTSSSNSTSTTSNDTDENTTDAEIALEASFVRPDRVAPGESVSNQLFNVKTHNLSLDGNQDTVTFIFPDKLIRNNTLGDQANQISSNVSIGSSVSAVDYDSDGTYEALQAGLQQDGGGYATANITLNTAMNYPEENTSFTVRVDITDSKTGSATTQLEEVVVETDKTSEETSQDTTSENQSSEQTQETTDETGNTTQLGSTDSSTPTDTESDTDSADRSEFDTGTSEFAETVRGEGPKIPRAREYGPGEKETTAIFGQVPENSRARLEFNRDRQLESLTVDPAGTPESFEISIENVDLNQVEGKEVYTARSIESSHEVESANITFQVNKSWVESKEREVVVKRLHEGSRNALGTTELNRTSEVVTYRAETPGFSKFAVTTETSTSFGDALTGQATENRTGVRALIISAIIVLLLSAGAYFYKKRRE